MNTAHFVQTLTTLVLGSTLLACSGAHSTGPYGDGDDDDGTTSSSSGYSSGSSGRGSSGGGSSSGASGGGSSSGSSGSRASCGGSCSSNAQCPSGATCTSTGQGNRCLPSGCATCFAKGLSCNADTSTCRTSQCGAPSGSSGGGSSSGGSSSGGSSSGGGATCHPANGCLGGSITPMTAGCGGTAKYFTGTFKNSCSKSVRCTICQPGGVDCQDWTFSPGESRGGWTTFLWCNSAGNSLQWTCTDAADPSSCR